LSILPTTTPAFELVASIIPASARLTALAITVFDLLCVMTLSSSKSILKTAKPYRKTIPATKPHVYAKSQVSD
jgi:hypothetical protein